MVSAVAVVPLEEIRVEDAAAYLLALAAAGKLLLFRYPNKPAGIPEDDEDLVMRAVVWARRFGFSVLRELGKYHPHLVPRARETLRTGKYRDLDAHL